MQTKFLALCCFILFIYPTLAQFPPWMGDTTYIDKNAKAKPVLMGGLDSRIAFLESRPVDIGGISLGFRFNRRHDINIGYYWLDNYTIRGILQDKRKLAPLTGNQLRFAALGYGRVLYNSRFFRLILPFEIGFGQAIQTVGNLNTNEKQIVKPFLPLQAGIYAQWKLTRWVGLGTSIGYRWAIFSGDFPANYNSMYVSYGLTFNGYHIIEDLFYDKRYKDIKLRKQH